MGASFPRWFISALKYESISPVIELDGVWVMSVSDAGFLVAFEGIDQSGKMSQVRLLVERLEKTGFKVRSLSFPIYSTAIGQAAKAFLECKHSYPPQVLHMILAANRWEVKDEIERWLGQGCFVIVNRYIYSNYAYGASKGLDSDWLEALDRGMPDPNLVILIDISPDTSLTRKLRGRDVHERDLELLSKVRENYLQLARSHEWITVNGETSIRTVHNNIWQALKPLLPKPPRSQHA